MRILFLLQDFPCPPTTGINRKVYSLLSGLAARGCDCDVLCFGVPGAAARVPAFEAAIPGVKVLRVVPLPSGTGGIVKKLLSLLRGLPPSLGGFSSAEFRAALLEAGESKSYVAVHYDVINMAQYLPWGPAAPSVLSSNDAISLFYERMIKESPGVLRRLYLLVSKHLIARYEKKVYPEFDRVHVVSEQDSAHLKKLCPGLVVEVIPIAADNSFLEYITPGALSGGKLLRVLFTGNLDIQGIANGLFDFLENACGTVIAGSAPFEFYVLGPKASVEDESRIAAFPGVKYFRWVEDYGSFVAGADILLSLDKSGTGIKTRVLDAMALGKPVIGTSIAFGGIEGENGKHFFVRNSPAETAAALKLLLGDRALREKAGKAARDLVLAKYSMAVVGPKWEALYAGLKRNP